ncbi:MAG: rod shape-determining protein RodA [Gammaproteobacteria bacterium]|nr:rod shape-determining protein RodA [Gammaproteobacteria bacterium]
MSILNFPTLWSKARKKGSPYVTIWELLHLDLILVFALSLLLVVGLIILYSAANQEVVVLNRQILRLALAWLVLFVCAQIPPQRYLFWAPYFFAVSLGLLIAVLLLGHIGKGAKRWLDVGFIRIQPSELLKISLPMMLAYYFHDKSLPPRLGNVIVAFLIIFIPAGLIAKQPDLGTALLITGSGLAVLVFAGLSWRWLVGALVSVVCIAPLMWHFMHTYQRERILTFLNPERDPLGSGYHIIQSKIALGSGGLFGKGWLQGTQSHLQFLPEHATDFIFAVCGEEFGLVGTLILISINLLIVGRALYISMQASDTFSRLLAGGLTLTFFISFFVNTGMVTGLLPVVGIPLPLVSYGGTSMVTLMAGLGIVMSIATRRKLIAA